MERPTSSSSIRSEDGRSSMVKVMVVEERVVVPRNEGEAQGRP
jgi:hypothetical protein